MIKDINEKKEYYSILGVERDAEQSAIKRAVCLYVSVFFLLLSTEWGLSNSMRAGLDRRFISRLTFSHPDKNKDEIAISKFLEIQRAFEILSDNETKKEYDTLLVEGRRKPLGEQTNY
jgi:hypothetical protein